VVGGLQRSAAAGGPRSTCAPLQQKQTAAELLAEMAGRFAPAGQVSRLVVRVRLARPNKGYGTGESSRVTVG
jgi:hypothetical protein